MAQEFEGVSSLGITTAAYIDRPEGAFASVNWLNEKGYNLGLEVYPFHTPGAIKKIGSLLGGGNGRFPIPEKVDPDILKDWKLIYPNARVTQLHLPFSYDLSQALYWAAYIGKDSPLSNMHHLAHMVCFGWATDGNTEKIVDAVDNPDLVLNIHPEIVWKAMRKGNLDSFTRLGRVSIEDSTNPVQTFKTLRENNLDLGFTLGLDHPDHLATRDLTVEKILEDDGVRKHTTAIHISGPNHGALSYSDGVSMGILQKIGETPFENPVIAYLDYFPSSISGMDDRQQIEFWQKQIRLIKSTQPQLV